MKSVTIENRTGHPLGTHVTDENGKEVRCRFPITVEISREGITAVLRVPVTKLVVGGDAADWMQTRAGVTETNEIGSTEALAAAKDGRES